MTVLNRLQDLLWWLPFGQVPEVSPVELRQSLLSDSPPQILDVRTGIEWRKSRIPGAVNVPIQELRRRLDALPLDRGQPIVAICLSAHRSIPAVRLLSARGYADVVKLQGGMLAWWKADYPTEAELEDT